jgi:alkyl sulfatase BDS1-like metallo-beta-lactamase superfamily hydrolase
MEKEEASEKTKNYNYIGYSQAFPVDQQKYALQADLLLKLAREAVRKQDYYSAIKYLNAILMKNPHNETAKYFKKEVMEILEKIKKSRTNKQGYTYI